MSREERQWHPNFIKYMNMIINHPNYQGLAISKKADGSYKWIATAKSSEGKSRINWCLKKAQELGIPNQPGVYAKVGTIYRDALKQNMANYMYVLWNILKNCPQNGQGFLIEAFLVPNFEYFEFDYSFNSEGEIIKQTPRHYTDRNRNESDRYCRIAIESVYYYMDKDNRNTTPYLTRSETDLLCKICDSINMETNLNVIKRKISELLFNIQTRIIKGL